MALPGLGDVCTGGAVRLRRRARDKEAHDCLLPRGLIALEGQDLVRPALYTLLSHGPLTAHGLNRHNAPPECQEVQ